jgi:2-polyprenyl-3-methyl-5-hydroxy-6-metoxy-1,4-benzoquinol methylase
LPDTKNSTFRNPIREIVASYRDPIIRIYSMLRFTILRQYFLDEIGQYLPQRGRILDIGCGFGLFSLYFAAVEGGRSIRGVDTNARRIEYARESARTLGLDNVSYEAGNALDWGSEERFDAVYLLDLLHHLPQGEVRPFLERVQQLLEPDGILIVKEVEDRPRWKVGFTLLLDRLMVGSEPIHYWAESELSALLRDLGFEVRHHRMKDFLPYPHILYIAQQRREGEA